MLKKKKILLIAVLPWRKSRPLTSSSAEMQVRQSSFWQHKAYADIHGGSLERGVKRQWGCRQRLFSVLLLAMSSEPLQMRPALLYGDIWSSSPASNDPKIHDLEWPWLATLNSAFTSARWAQEFVAFEDNWVQTNKDRHTLSAKQMFCRESSFRRYKVYADIRGRSL